MSDHDQYCFQCYRSETEFNCVNCPRSYHRECVKVSAFCDKVDVVNQENWLCPVCLFLKSTIHNPNEVKTIPVVLKSITKAPWFEKLSKLEVDPAYHNNNLIVHPISVQSILKKQDKYGQLEEIICDAGWCLHNCLILFGENHIWIALVNELITHITSAIEDIRLCWECFLNKHSHPKEWFPMVCTDPHIIVWAKKNGFTYWPAKLLTIDGQLLKIQYFGDHAQENVPATNCFLYSECSPNRFKSTSFHFVAATEESQLYINNVQQKFGSFKYAEQKTVFNTKKLNEYKYTSENIPTEEIHQDLISKDADNQSAGGVLQITDNSMVAILDNNETNQSCIEKINLQKGMNNATSAEILKDSVASKKPGNEKVGTKNKRDQDEFQTADAKIAEVFLSLKSIQEVLKNASKCKEENKQLTELQHNFRKAQQKIEMLEGEKITLIARNQQLLDEYVNAPKDKEVKHFCDACGKPVETVLYCNNVCGKNHLKRTMEAEANLLLENNSKKKKIDK